MEITIHRGVNQIGGCITEISTEGCKVFIDLGCNLPGSGMSEISKEKVEALTSDADAIFYTHYHGDHVGLHHLVPKGVPQYIGGGAKDVMLLKYKALRQPENYGLVSKMSVYSPSRGIDVGGKGLITVTPYFIDHSAFDAYMFKNLLEKLKEHRNIFEIVSTATFH